MKESVRGALAVALAGLLWGTWKIWLRGPVLDPAAQGALVLTAAGLLGSAVALLGRRRFTGVPRAAWGLLALFGLLEAANYLLYFRALSAGDSATASVTHYLAPVLVAVCSPLLREPMGRRAPIAAPIACLATLALVGLGSGGPATRTAAVFGAGSALFYAAIVFASKRLSQHFRPWELMGFHNLLAAPIVWCFSATPPWHAGAAELAWGVVGALVGGTVASVVYFFGLARVPAARAAVLAYVEPVSTTLVGVLALGEGLSGLKIGAMAVIVLAGIAVASESPPAQPQSAPEPSV